MHGQKKIFHAGSHEFRESLRELLREFRFSHCTSRETPFREWDFAFRELFSELRELFREYPGTLPELREWSFHSESVFPEIGVVPRPLQIDGSSGAHLFGNSFKAVVALQECHSSARTCTFYTRTAFMKPVANTD